MQITDDDREAANALRVVLADICGFWHKPGDDSPLCLALARHRLEAERRTGEKLTPITLALAPAHLPIETGRAHARPRRPRRLAGQRLGERAID